MDNLLAPTKIWDSMLNWDEVIELLTRLVKEASFKVFIFRQSGIY
jgi:hypothetical protein